LEETIRILTPEIARAVRAMLGTQKCLCVSPGGSGVEVKISDLCDSYLEMHSMLMKIQKERNDIYEDAMRLASECVKLRIGEEMPKLINVRTDVFVKEIFDKIEPENKIFIDVGASNGIDYDPTYGLTLDNWSGILFEASEDKHNAMCRHLPNYLIKIKEIVTPDNIIPLLEKNNVPKNVGAISIDIDGYDYFVIKALLENGYLADSFCVECNTIFPPGINWTVLYKPGLFWAGNTHFLGCSFSLYDKLFKKYGYEVVFYDWENAYYVKKECFSKFNVVDNSLATMWNNGYWKRPDRGLPGGFDWNNDFKIADLAPNLQLHFIRNHGHIRTHKENSEFILFHDTEYNDKHKELLGLT
jgi:hypothetical protein